MVCSLESSTDAEHVAGQSGVMQGQMGQLLMDSGMEVNLGGSSHLSMLKLWRSVPGHQGSSNSNITFGWSRPPMPKMLKVSQGHPRSNGVNSLWIVVWR